LNINPKNKNGLLLSDSLPQPFIESYMMLESVIRHTAKSGNMKKLLLTSSLEKEGKTLISVNLAIALAKSGKNVLLIDCDLRKPNLYKTLNITRNEVNDLYSILISDENNLSFDKCIIKKMGISVIPFLCPCDVNNIIFTLPSFNNAINILSERYDYIIFDSAPAYAINDTMNLVSIADGIIFVIKQEYASLNILKDTVNNIVKVGGDIIGCVLNDIKYHNIGSGYKEKYKYYFKNKYIYRDDFSLKN
jgi:capsular exopolysaccharide synthesis family protein